MKVLVLTDASFAHREHQLLTRLEIGLADDGATVVHVVPARVAADTASAFSSMVVRYDDTPLPLGRAARAREVIKATGEMLDETDFQVDLIHVFGERAWRMGAMIAAQLNSALVLEVWRRDLAADAMRLARTCDGFVGLLTSSQRIHESLTAAAGGRTFLGLAPWGVPASENVRSPIPARESGEGIAVSVLAEGGDPQHSGIAGWGSGSGGIGEMRRLLEGLANVAKTYDNLLIFLDAPAADHPGVWRAARRLGLLDRMTTVAEMEARREPILHTDILALPEPRGVCRTLPLAAMAEGVSIVARPDVHHEPWLNSTTARLVGQAGSGKPGQPAPLPRAEEWEMAIVNTIEGRAETAALRQAARTLVRQQRPVAAYVDAVRALYAELLNAGKPPSRASTAISAAG